VRKATLVAVAAAAYLAFLVALMPASYAIAHGELPPGLQLEAPRGTLWNGEARALVRNAGAMLAIDRLAWRFVPSQLLAGRIAFDVEARAPNLEAHGRLQHGFGGPSASDVSLRADAAVAAALSPLAGAWQPQGTVTLSAPKLAWNARELTGDAQAEWRGARVALPQPRALGSYRAEIHGTGGPAKLAISTLEGDYKVRGDGTVTPGAIDIRGQAGGQDFALRLP
jgi:hypothetical protein